MGYKVKWVEDNLGVSRKALRNFEKLGLMPPNEGGKYRDYTDEDIERIWTIRLFQGMGYSLKEIVSLIENEMADIDVSLEKKIKELEEKKENIERHIGYAQAIKSTGRFPFRPKEMGSITFKDFQENALDVWNINSWPGAKELLECEDIILNTPEDEFEDEDMSKLFTSLSASFQKLLEKVSNQDSFMVVTVIPNEILKRKERGVADDEVQLLVKIMYENFTGCFTECSTVTINEFVRCVASVFVVGDIAKIYEQMYGKDGCLFIADAIAVFGGYHCFDEIYSGEEK